MLKPFILFIATTFLAGTFYSCTPKHDTTTRDLIAGDWSMTIVADDHNGNGVMDSIEIATGSITPSPTYTFVSSGSGYVTLLSNPKTDFTWELVDNTTMKITGTTPTSTPVTVTIDNLTATDMTLKNTAGGLTSWEVFKKK
jgi:hypothetical protein